MHSATAQAHPNIAFIKYWGNRNDPLRLPANGSISMNLDGLFTRTRVDFDPELRVEGTLGRGLARLHRFVFSTLDWGLVGSSTLSIFLLGLQPTRFTPSIL